MCQNKELEILFSSDSCQLELPFYQWELLYSLFYCQLVFSVSPALVLLYVLLTFIMLLQLFEVVNNFLKFFLKTFFVSSCCCLIDNSKYTTTYYSCQQLFSIFSKKFFTIFYQTIVRLFYIQIFQFSKTNNCSIFGKMGKYRLFLCGGY